MPTADCEVIGTGLLLQPVNAVSSLVFVVVGTLVMASAIRSKADLAVRTSFAGVLVLVGLGSFAFHGPGGLVAGWAHDVSLSILFLLVLAVEVGAHRHWTTARTAVFWIAPAAVLAGAAALAPESLDAVNAVLVVPAIGAVILRLLSDRDWASGRSAVAGLGLLLMGAAVMVLSRTGGPLCVPDSLVQGHAVWHVLAAAGVGLYAGNGAERFAFSESL